VGRIDEAEQLYTLLAAQWPYARDMRGLNISANWAGADVELGRYADALSRIDGVIANATARGPEVNLSALADLHLVRVCALHKLGRDAEAIDSVKLINSQQLNLPKSYMGMLACTGDRAEAKAFLLRRLADPERYAFALDFVQPRSDVPPTAYLAERRRFNESLANDRDILEAVAKVGRKLSFPVLGPRPAS
jgi:hypothetical protein